MQITNIKHEKGVISDPTDIKRTIEYYEQLYAN